jgi:tRNA threonylcarbamoyladenosine biosynthesis protein TsaB
MLLALDTATRMIGMALYDGQQIIAEFTWRTASRHTVELAPAIEDMMQRVGVTPPDLTAIAVTLGPGSYTGLRIGMGVAKGLALAANPPLPLIGIPTLDIVAAAQPHLANRLCVVAQAGRGRISAGFYTWEANRWQSTGQPTITNWETLLEQPDMPTQFGGEIDSKGRALLVAHPYVILAPSAHALRRAGFLAELGYRRFADGEVDEPAILAPIYLNEP